MDFFFYVIKLIVTSYSQSSRSGSDKFINKSALCLTDFSDEGQIKINGEIWKAKTNIPLKKGQSVIIKKIEGLTTFVEPKGDQS